MDNVESSQSEHSQLGASALDKFSELGADVVEYVETETRRAPFKALSCAVVAGYLLRNLPVFALFGVFFRLALILVRPAALIFGGVKLCQLLADMNPPSQRAE